MHNNKGKDDGWRMLSNGLHHNLHHMSQKGLQI